MANLTKKPKAESTALANWDAELAKFAEEAAATEVAPTGSFISTRGGRLTFGGNPMKDNKVNVVVIDYIFENAYYEGKFDPDAPASPVCYAFAHGEDELSPHDKAEDKQSEQCKGCEKNEFGSADVGRGKACKNQRRLAVLAADGLDVNALEKGAIAYMRIPPTSIGNWGQYVKSVANVMKRPPFGVVTEISIEPDEKTQFKIVFQAVAPIEKELLGALMKRREQVIQEIEFPYQTAAEKPVQIKKPAKARKF